MIHYKFGSNNQQTVRHYTKLFLNVGKWQENKTPVSWWVDLLQKVMIFLKLGRYRLSVYSCYHLAAVDNLHCWCTSTSRVTPYFTRLLSRWLVQWCCYISHVTASPLSPRTWASVWFGVDFLCLDIRWLSKKSKEMLAKVCILPTIQQ